MDGFLSNLHAGLTKGQTLTAAEKRALLQNPQLLLEAFARWPARDEEINRLLQGPRREGIPIKVLLDWVGSGSQRGALLCRAVKSSYVQKALRSQLLKPTLNWDSLKWFQALTAAQRTKIIQSVLLTDPATTDLQDIRALYQRLQIAKTRISQFTPRLSPVFSRHALHLTTLWNQQSRTQNSEE